MAWSRSPGAGAPLLLRQFDTALDPAAEEGEDDSPAVSMLGAELHRRCWDRLFHAAIATPSDGRLLLLYVLLVLSISPKPPPPWPRLLPATFTASSHSSSRSRKGAEVNQSNLVCPNTQQTLFLLLLATNKHGSGKLAGGTEGANGMSHTSSLTTREWRQESAQRRAHGR